MDNINFHELPNNDKLYGSLYDNYMLKAIRNRYYIGNSPNIYLSITTMNKQILFASVLAVLGLTACEKGLTDDIGDVGSGQVKNSLLQVRTRGSSPGSEATVAYPLQVYVFQGDQCRAARRVLRLSP